MVFINLTKIEDLKICISLSKNNSVTQKTDVNDIFGILAKNKEDSDLYS
jgi:hypothetical protein